MANMLAVLGVLSALAPLQDPTMPLVMPELQHGQERVASQPRLQSVILGSGPAIAVLDGKGYRHGEEVAGWRVLSIGLNRVELGRENERLSLSLFGNSIVR
ncbi:hypothetical protein [Aeromonas simiae]|uniref:SctD/MshK family protein n=1 Tax=Aeromonas simiae TaxID=218936 RepID=UPI0009FF38BF